MFDSPYLYLRVGSSQLDVLKKTILVEFLQKI
jgi:hypothetical protein